MKNVIKQAIVAGIFSLSLVLGSVVNAAGVPEPVEKALLEKYPTAHDIKWKTYTKDEYQASFIVDEQEGHAFIKKDGELVESHIQLNEENIPEGIKEQIAQIRNVSLLYILSTTDANNFEYYRAKVKVDNELFELNFDKDNTMISQHRIH